MTYSQDPGLQPALSVCVVGFINTPTAPFEAHSPRLSAEVEAEDKECFKQIKKGTGSRGKTLDSKTGFYCCFGFCGFFGFVLFSVSAQAPFELLILWPLSPRTEITGVHTTPHPAHAVLGIELRTLCV